VVCALLTFQYLTERKEMATPTRARMMPPKKLQPSKPPPLPESGLTGTEVVTLGVTEVEVTVLVDVVVDVIVVLVVGVSVVVEVVVVVLAGVAVEVVEFWVDVVGGGNVVEVLELGVVALSGSSPLSGGTMVVKSSMGSFSPSTKPSAASWTTAVLGVVVSTFSALASSAAFSV